MKIRVGSNTKNNSAVDRHTFNRQRPDPSRPFTSAHCQKGECKHCASLKCTHECHHD